MSSAATSVRQERPFVVAPGWPCMVGAVEDDGCDNMEIASSRNRQTYEIFSNRYYVQKYELDILLYIILMGLQDVNR